jgi:hypothetical protein
MKNGMKRIDIVTVNKLDTKENLQDTMEMMLCRIRENREKDRQ